MADANGSIWSKGTLVAGRYRVDDRLGSGGMGEVYRAHDNVLRRAVALKRLRTRDRSQLDLRRRALREARRAGGLRDAGIAAVHDVLDTDDGLVLVLELVEGGTLRQVVAQPAELDVFLGVASQILRAVGAAHRQGILHGDLKPENIMITPAGEAKVLDFGLARSLRVDSGVDGPDTTTELPHLGGTPAYMAPEVHRGEEPDERADIFSLGVVFYELLCGARPFRAETLALQIERTLREPPPPLGQRREDLPEALDTLIGRMLAKEPADRPATIDEVAVVIAELRGDPTPLTPTRTSDQSRVVARPRRQGRHTFSKLVAGVLLVAAAVTTAVLLVRQDRSGTTGADVLLPDRPNVAVLPFEGGGRSRAEQAFAVGAAALVHHELAPLDAAPPWQFARFADVADTAGDDRAVNLHARWGVNVVLETSYRQAGARYAVEIRMRRAEDGRQIDRRSLDAPLDADRFLSAVHAAMIGMLGVSETDAGPVWFADEAGTLAFYARGLGYLWMSLGPGLDGAERIELYEDAAREIGTALRTRIGFPRGHAALADVDCRWGRSLRRTAPDEAERRFREGLAEADAAIAADPDLAEGHHARGEILVWLGDDAGAERSLRRCLELRPSDHEAARRLVQVLKRTGGIEAAEAFLRERASARPHDYRVHLELGSLLAEQGRWPEALEAMEATTRAAPDYHRGYLNAGGVLIGLGRYEEAASRLERALELFPSYEAYANLGTCFFFQRRLAEAATLYRRAIERGHADRRMWRNLGDALYFAGASAEEAYEKALSLSADLARPDPEVSAERALLLARLGRDDEARGEIARVDGIEGIPHALKDLALAYWELGDEHEALERLGQAAAAGITPTQLRDSAEFDPLRGAVGFEEGG